MFDFVDRCIDRLEGVNRTDLTQDESLKIVASNLLSVIGNNNKTVVVLLTSSILNADFSDFCNKLSSKLPPDYILQWVQNPCFYPEAARQLADCTGVVLLEREGKSKHIALERLIESVNDKNKEIYGFIMV